MQVAACGLSEHSFVFKQQQVVDSFERIGGFSNLNILPIIGADEIYFYRGKMEYSFAEKQWLTEKPFAIDDFRLSD